MGGYNTVYSSQEIIITLAAFISNFSVGLWEKIIQLMRSMGENARHLRNKTKIKPRRWKILLNNELSLEFFRL